MATYNCTETSNSAYGSGGYGTCTGQTVGAPNTGVFSQIIDSACKYSSFLNGYYNAFITPLYLLGMKND